MDWDTCKICILPLAALFGFPIKYFFVKHSKITDGKWIVDTSVDREMQDGEEQIGRTCGKGIREDSKYLSLVIKFLKEHI